MSLTNTTCTEDKALERLSEYSDDVSLVVKAIERLDEELESVKSERDSLEGDLASTIEAMEEANSLIAALREEVASLEGDK